MVMAHFSLKNMAKTGQESVNLFRRMVEWGPNTLKIESVP